jgi:hypothetical protein
MDQNSAYKYIQELFCRGLVTIVGSGASCALGLPSMEKLNEYLQENIPTRMPCLAESSATIWKEVAQRLANGEGLESALDAKDLPRDLGDAITDAIIELVGASEEKAIQAMIVQPETSAFGMLFHHLLQNNEIADVITTNYDRLLEVAAALATVRLDSMFYGHTVGWLDARLSREELSEPVVHARRPTDIRLRLRAHIRLSKPHGSLDWFPIGDKYVRSELKIPGARQIIAPGGRKYRLGYDIPYDEHRKRANNAMDNAAGFLAIGFGFNDDHLQTHLKAKFPQVPSVIVAKTLTYSAKEYLALSPNAIGIEANPSGTGSLLTQESRQISISANIWKLDELMKEVLGK